MLDMVVDDRDWAEFAARDEALHWLRVTLLQVERYVGALSDVAGAGPQMHRDPSAVTRAVADAHFLLNACAQAEKALAIVGRDQAFAIGSSIRALRDVHEHWEQHKATFASKCRPKSRSGRALVELHPDTIPWVFKRDATGTWISALRVEDLWMEALGLEQSIEMSLIEMSTRLGLGAPPRLANPNRPFPPFQSPVLGFTMVTQSIILEPPTPDARSSPSMEASE